MRNSQQRGPRGDFRGARREHPRQGGGPGGGRRRNRHHRSERPEGERQRPPQARGPRRERPRQAHGKPEHRPPQDRRNRHHRSEHPEGERQGPSSQGRGPRRQHKLETRRNSEQHRPRANRRRVRQGNFRPNHPMRSAFGGRKNRRRKSGWHPSIEFSVFEDRFEVIVELPGVSENSANVSVTDKLLIVKGEKQRKQTDEKHKVRRSELQYGRFKRVCPLPPSAKADGIKAEFKDGVLTIVIPKTEDAKPTEISINADV